MTCRGEIVLKSPQDCDIPSGEGIWVEQAPSLSLFPSLHWCLSCWIGSGSRFNEPFFDVGPDYVGMILLQIVQAGAGGAELGVHDSHTSSLIYPGQEQCPNLTQSGRFSGDHKWPILGDRRGKGHLVAQVVSEPFSTAKKSPFHAPAIARMRLKSGRSASRLRDRVYVLCLMP